MIRRRPEGYAFPPGIMSTPQGAYYVGDLSIASFLAEMAEHGIKPVSLRGRRIGWLIEDLDRYREIKAGRPPGESDGREWLEAIDGSSS